MELLAGTSGFSYKEWLGAFYPEKLPAKEMLNFYAQRFRTVEINNTFYRMPAESMLQQWTTQVPPHFLFTLKAPKRITHDKRLKEVEGDLAEFLRRAHALGDQLGIVLFQLPPYLKKDLPRLVDFLALLPQAPRFAFEFRNDSWQDDEVHRTLAERSAMLCVTDTDTGDTPYATTADWGYLRLRRTHYEPRELRAWAERIAGKGLARTCVYFMHEDEALGTRFATTLLEAWREIGA
jgi:uncharacterized protein YecE (DUF72 family)